MAIVFLPSRYRLITMTWWIWYVECRRHVLTINVAIWRQRMWTRQIQHGDIVRSLSLVKESISRDGNVSLFIQGASAQLEDILNTVDRLQKTRLNDQRTHLPSPTISHDAARAERLSPLNEQFFEQLAKCQVRLSSLMLEDIGNEFVFFLLGFSSRWSTSRTDTHSES